MSPKKPAISSSAACETLINHVYKGIIDLQEYMSIYEVLGTLDMIKMTIVTQVQNQISKKISDAVVADATVN